jgi:hypothetical protein
MLEEATLGRQQRGFGLKLPSPTVAGRLGSGHGGSGHGGSGVGGGGVGVGGGGGGGGAQKGAFKSAAALFFDKDEDGGDSDSDDDDDDDDDDSESLYVLDDDDDFSFAELQGGDKGRIGAHKPAAEADAGVAAVKDTRAIDLGSAFAASLGFGFAADEASVAPAAVAPSSLRTTGSAKKKRKKRRSKSGVGSGGFESGVGVAGRSPRSSFSIPQGLRIDSSANPEQTTLV